MAAYKLLRDGAVLRTADGASIPPDPRNGDRKAYDAWLALGNTPDPADPKPPRLRAVAQVQSEVETWLVGATAAQRNKALAWALTLGAIANGKLDALKALTNVDATEPDA